MGDAKTTILVVEDNDLDVENLLRCFKRLKIENPVVRAKDGLEGLDLLRRHDPGNRLDRPYIVLLDLNMPRMNGIEFLEQVRQEEAIADTPVFVLTTSSHHQDVQAAHRHHVCGYIVKPMERKRMLEALGMLDAYCQICELPAENRLPC